MRPTISLYNGLYCRSVYSLRAAYPRDKSRASDEFFEYLVKRYKKRASNFHYPKEKNYYFINKKKHFGVMYDCI